MACHDRDGGEAPSRWLAVQAALALAFQFSTSFIQNGSFGEYVEPGPRDAEETLARSIALLDSQDLARAIERLEKVQGLRVVK
jgi:hypothetical protein